MARAAFSIAAIKSFASASGRSANRLRNVGVASSAGGIGEQFHQRGRPYAIEDGDLATRSGSCPRPNASRSTRHSTTLDPGGAAPTDPSASVSRSNFPPDRAGRSPRRHRAARLHRTRRWPGHTIRSSCKTWSPTDVPRTRFVLAISLPIPCLVIPRTWPVPNRTENVLLESGHVVTTRRHSAGTGIAAVRVVPWPMWLVMCRWPPSASIRSVRPVSPDPLPGSAPPTPSS